MHSHGSSLCMHTNGLVSVSKSRRAILTIIQQRRFSLFGHTAWMPDKTDAKILTASPWRTELDHQNALILRRWWLSSKTWNAINYPCIKHLTWLRIVHSQDWCLSLTLCTPSGACQKRRRLDWIVQCFTCPPTQYRLYGRRFLQIKRPNQQYQSTEGKYTKENNPENKENTKYTCIHTKW